jgi:hypothetical protein
MTSWRGTGEWIKQMGRNLLDADDGFLHGKRYVILDRDPLYTKEFRQMLRGAGVKPLLLPARSPNLNAYAERFVLSIKSECLDRIVPLGEKHLRRAIGEYLAHYHGERNHQGLDNVLLKSAPASANENGRVLRRERSVACSTTTTAMPLDRGSILFRDTMAVETLGHFAEHTTSASGHQRSRSPGTLFGSLRSGAATRTRKTCAS